MNFLRKIIPLKIRDWLLHKKRRIRGKPEDIARGFSLGVFIGMTPLLGLHAILCFFAAPYLKASRISSILVSSIISSPFGAPFLYTTTAHLGGFFIGAGRNVIIESEEPVRGIFKLIHSAPRLFFSMLIGGIILAIPLVPLTYYLSLKASKIYHGAVMRRFKRRNKRN